MYTLILIMCLSNNECHGYDIQSYSSLRKCNAQINELVSIEVNPHALDCYNEKKIYNSMMQKYNTLNVDNFLFSVDNYPLECG